MARLPGSPVQQVILREGLPGAWRGLRDSLLVGGKAWPAALMYWGDRLWDLRQAAVYSGARFLMWTKGRHILQCHGLA